MSLNNQNVKFKNCLKIILRKLARLFISEFRKV